MSFLCILYVFIPTAAIMHITGTTGDRNLAYAMTPVAGNRVPISIIRVGIEYIKLGLMKETIPQKKADQIKIKTPPSDI